MTFSSGSSGSTDLALAQNLLLDVNGSWTAQAFYVAAELELADRLSEGPKSSADLARLTETDAHALQRLLRALTTLEILDERADGRFELTARGSLLRRDHPYSIRSWILWWATSLAEAWGELHYSIRSGQSARAMLQGTRGFGHLEKDPKAAEIFNQALVEVTRLTTGLAIANYDFSGFDRIVDVGGGYGELLAAFLHANADASGILFDRPHARDGALERFRSAGLESRFEFVAGDFFEFVPEAADAFVLKNVLHDWGDSDGQKILESCRRAMRPHSRLLIIERLLPTKLERSPAHRDLVRADLTMLVAHGAGERSEADYRRLLDASGFAVNQIVPIGMTFSVIEAQLASG